ncbi:AAA family ATPase [bacterium]|nr:AAA family ATPase [bacterium]
MATKALAIKYRPETWNDVSEQNSTKIILQQQLESGEVKNAYLFCGPAGCGKTTCARIFANDINKCEGNPIELDAASNNGVDDVREIIQQAKTKSLDSEYKIFIIDECHALSNSAWQAMLKIIEEPPAKSIFIFCTTNPERIPKTILSRVQRYDFNRISTEGIVNRLKYILEQENKE